MPSLEFDLEHAYPDDPARGIEVPVLLELGDRNTRCLAHVDTGAGYCIFRSDYAELLGLDVEQGTPIRVIGAGGGVVDAYGHMMTVEVLGHRVDSQIYFTRNAEFRRNVLGRQGWLHHFKFGLLHYESKLYLGSL
ncbi:MAG TPA: retropepsin-like aspartic protease [Terracidiphilus sp.]